MRGNNLIPIVIAIAGCIIAGAILYATASPQLADAADAQHITAGPNNTDHPVGIDVAKANIKKFTGNQGMDVEFDKNVTTLHGKGYSMKSKSGLFFVNTTTGAVENAEFYNANINSSIVRLSQDQAEKIAADYASRHYNDFSKMKNMSMTGAGLIDHGMLGKEYDFSWREMVNGIYTLNQTYISVNPNDGRIISYIGIQRPLAVSLESKIVKDDALKIAAGQFENISVVESNADLEVAYITENTQKVVWYVEIIGEPANGGIPGGAVTIDANTGEVLNVNPYK